MISFGDRGDDLQQRCGRRGLFRHHLRKLWGLHDPQPEVEADGHEHQAEQERDAESPGDERIFAENAVEHRHQPGCEDQAIATPSCGQLPMRPRRF